MPAAALRTDGPGARGSWLRWLGIPVAIGLAAASSYMAAANVFADRNPSLVLRLSPQNPVALMRMVDFQLASGGILQKAAPNWALDARTALRAAPINPSAVRTLGLVAAGRGDREKAKRMMVLAEGLSRRDLPTELWLTLDAARREDAHETMAHIDTALSTRRATAPLVFSILGRILVDPRISREFAQLVRQDRTWLSGFLSYADENKLDPVVLANVLIQAGGLPRGKDYHAYETDVLWSLSGRGKPDKAAELLVKLGRANQGLLANGEVSDSTLDPDLGPFAWTTSLDPDVSSSFQADQSVFAQIAPGKRGMILQRFMALPAGNYRISAIPRLLTEDASASLTVEVACALMPQAELLSAYMEVGPHDRLIDKPFAVGTNCPIQLVRLSSVGGENQIDSELSLSKISLRRTGASASRANTDQSGPKSQK